MVALCAAALCYSCFLLTLLDSSSAALQFVEENPRNARPGTSCSPGVYDIPFLLRGFLHHRVGSTDVISLCGVAQRIPLLTAGFFLFGLAGAGIPGRNGFPAEFLLVLSAVSWQAVCIHTACWI
jgi:hypothetical protein